MKSFKLAFLSSSFTHSVSSFITIFMILAPEKRQLALPPGPLLLHRPLTIEHRAASV